MIIEFMSTFSHANFKFKGIKIGFSEIELGIKLGQIVTVYGEIIYNIKKKSMWMTKPEFIMKDKSLLKRLI